MDIRLEDMVLHKTSGLKQQWQFSPWITSHRFQLPLRWYARVRLIRHTFMSSATKHLASQRDAHLLLRTIRPPTAWRNVSWASSPWPLLATECLVVDVDCQCTRRGSYGDGEGGSGSSLRRLTAMTNTPLQRAAMTEILLLSELWRGGHYTRKKQ